VIISFGGHGPLVVTGFLGEGAEQEVTLVLCKLSEEHVVVELTFVEEEVDPPTPPSIPLINMAGGYSFILLVCRNQ
jgi:hypothetical protein